MITLRDLLVLTSELITADSDGSGEHLKAFVREAGVDPNALEEYTTVVSHSALESLKAGEIPAEQLLPSIALSAFIVGLKAAPAALVKAAE